MTLTLETKAESAAAREPGLEGPRLFEKPFYDPALVDGVVEQSRDWLRVERTETSAQGVRLVFTKLEGVDRPLEDLIGEFSNRLLDLSIQRFLRLHPQR